MNVKISYRLYKWGFRVIRVIFYMLFFYKIIGRENVPQGAAIICPNHSSLIDPIVVSLACGIDHHIHYVAKIELFRVPVLSFVIRKLGAISVDRNASDTSTIKAMLSCLKSGKKVGIFPEGRRIRAGEVSQMTLRTDTGREDPESMISVRAEPEPESETPDSGAKYGAVKIAERTGVPIVPVYVPRKKTIFKRLVLTIGEPFFIEKQSEKRSNEDFTLLAESLMSRIEALNPQLRKLTESGNKT